jgi:S1-C subfamily serine protease
MIPWEVWSRVVRLAGESGRLGTGFIIDVDSGRFLVTAKHMCGEDREEQITLSHPWTNDGSPIVQILERVGDLNALGDVAAFSLTAGLPIETGGEVVATSDGFVYSQDCYLMGYPYGLATSFDRWEMTQQLPIVKRAIISGSSFENGGFRSIDVDTIANPGFSGGPLVFENQKTASFHFGGVIRGTLMAPLKDEPEDEVQNPRVVSGLSQVTDLHAILALLP